LQSKDESNQPLNWRRISAVFVQLRRLGTPSDAGLVVGPRTKETETSNDATIGKRPLALGGAVDTYSSLVPDAASVPNIHPLAALINRRRIDPTRPLGFFHLQTHQYDLAIARSHNRNAV